MIFNEEHHAVDWVFRYGNPALAELEKKPLEQLLDHSFGSLFSNMDSKWLRAYERATLYGETLEIIDYSPEIDTYLKVICFPTFSRTLRLYPVRHRQDPLHPEQLRCRKGADALLWKAPGVNRK